MRAPRAALFWRFELTADCMDILPAGKTGLLSRVCWRGLVGVIAGQLGISEETEVIVYGGSCTGLLSDNGETGPGD